MPVSLEIKCLTKKFGNNFILNNISLESNLASSIVFLGENGSGKSTMIKILCGYLYYDTGKILWNNNDSIIPDFSISAPYIDLFEQLTIEEHLKYHFLFKNRFNNINDNEILEKSFLKEHKHKFIKQLSSGLKQRFKNILSIFSDTQVLFLDEPCSNLDEQNIKLYQKLVLEFSANRLLIMASNSKPEYDFINPLMYKIDKGKLELL